MYYNLFETGRTRQRGSIEVICGSMFSGKTEELLRRLRRAQIAGLEVEIFKPSLDTRYDEVQVVSHDQNKIPSTPVDHSSNILLLGSDVDVVGIDEAQFLDNHLPEVVEALADQGIRVISAGLDLDFRRKPFGPMADLGRQAPRYLCGVWALGQLLLPPRAGRATGDARRSHRV